MLISHVKLQNWKNFQHAEASLLDVTYVLGANATGKSNLLDVFRFLRDIAKPQGGGIQKAVADRGGLKKLRCLHARSKPEIVIEVHLSDNFDDPVPIWRYVLALKAESSGIKRPIIAAEEVYKLVDGKERCFLRRPDKDDVLDRERLTQTSLEQIQTNSDFRELADQFSEITYLHLVPQLVKFGSSIGGQTVESDPFGQAFLERVAKANGKVRTSRLGRIQKALSIAVPQFEELKFVRDEITGRPHLEARYAHHRPAAGWQREDQFSDGTLRLIALFWLLMEGDSLLLLEEPELSLDEEIVRNLPRLIEQVRRSTKKRQRQIIISTHSQALLDNKSVDGRGVLWLDRVQEGTVVRSPSDEQLELMREGYSPAEILLSKAHPKDLHKMVLN
ncbi:putative ATPase [Methylosinus sp. sav-2]|jgi:predicted ATPase|uniref:AAA family ATPase n=1 Tax=Methylosinus sp. sav-2 TaxID=2485168 RepID=UPI000A07AF45|nr:ATP-binding protein [Methylosinus sp. sav-2]TDX62667.1 putative ATPase [Methylosinus sp. sav-2]